VPTKNPIEAVLIRPARLNDLQALVRLEAAFPGDRLSRRAWRRHLASPRSLCLVAAGGSDLLGDVLLLRRADSRWWRLYSLVRSPNAPRGTGRRLLDAALAKAQEAGAAGVRLEVRGDNKSAIELYRSLGFVLFSVVDGYYEDGAAALRMALAFAD
jgi:ribosomal protein S18 acetylase RimI-like enzyme